MQMKKIMLIPPICLPVPSVGGGAIETLITNLLDINEIEQKVQFIVISKYDMEASKIKYEHSKVYYLQNERSCIVGSNWFKLLWFLYRIWLKIFQNRIAVKISRKWLHRMNFFEFQCYWIAKINKVDYIVNEGHWGETELISLNHVVGSENYYTHIHCVRKEDKRARRATSNSISISDYVKKKWVVDQSITGQNRVLYNGIDIEKFRREYSMEEKKAIRSSLNISEDEFVVLFCGRIIPEKGIKELLDAFDMLDDEKYKLVLIGSVAFSDSQKTEYSEQMMKRAMTAKNVIPVGYVPNDKISDYYAISDIQVVPSIWQEGAGLVAIEGMAAGKPLIVTESGGMTEYVDHNAAIQLPINEKLSENMAKSIKMLASNSEYREKMGAAGRERAKLFTRARYYHNFISIFGDV